MAASMRKIREHCFGVANWVDRNDTVDQTVLEMLELGADAMVLTFDRAMQTTIRIPLREMGANLVVVEHGVSEMPGMRSMAAYLEKTFPGVKATCYWKEPAAVTVGGEREPR